MFQALANLCFHSSMKGKLQINGLIDQLKFNKSIKGVAFTGPLRRSKPAVAVSADSVRWFDSIGSDLHRQRIQY